jgi:hypothetical protein
MAAPAQGGSAAVPATTAERTPGFDRARFRRLFVAVMLPMFLAAVDQRCWRRRRR